MGLLFPKTAGTVIPLLLCLLLRSIKSQGIQQHYEGINKSEEKIGLEQFPIRQEAISEVLPKKGQNTDSEPTELEEPVTTQEVISEIHRAQDTSITQKEGEENEEQIWKNNTEKDRLDNNLHTDLRENMTHGTNGTIQRQKSKKLKEKKSRGGKKANPRVLDNVWFKDTLNVTIRPVVTWSRRAAAPPPSPVAMESRKDQDQDQEHQQEEEDDILLTVKFIWENHSLILDLHPNRDLLAESYRESNAGAQGYDTLPAEMKAVPCEYQGVLRGQKESWVALSVCDGLSGIVFVSLEGGEEMDLMVEPLPNSTSPHEPHRIFNSKILKLPERVCGVETTNPREEIKDTQDTFNEERKMNASDSPYHRTRRWVGLVGEALWFKKNTRFVELVLVADHSFYITHGARTRSRCKSIANIVNAVYRYLGVVVVLSHLEVWEDKDKIHVTGDYTNNLNLMKKYRRKMVEEQPHYNNDNTMLLTTVKFNDRTVGYASVSGMCSIDYSVGVLQDKQEHEGVVAYVLAHEMGHNFGMNHDEDGKDNQKCYCASPPCVMAEVSSSEYQPHTLWSSCSKQVIEERLDSASYECLRNVPSRMYPSSSCGDGIKNDNEDCDCGPKEFCHNPCCIAATCRFAPNAYCASGPCCDTEKCGFKSRGVTCRENFTECDLPEFCSGNSESCPADVTKADGTPCFGEQGYCYEGQCSSHLGMCRTVWGPAATVADEKCYKILNTKGGSNGNCGFKTNNNTDFQACADSDKLCGSLQCVTREETPIPKLTGVRYGTYLSHPPCSYIVPSSGTPTWYWLTPDGAKCGKGKMCLKQKCVSVPERTSHCREGCSGRGVCNSRDHCHCNPGFAPPYCSKEGEGGSIDSHRVGRARYKDPLWEALFFLSLIGIGIVAILCCLWSLIYRWWEDRGRASTPPWCARCLDACCCPFMSFIMDRLCIMGKKEDISREAQDPAEQDKMMRQVDLEKEAVTNTPQNSSEFRQKMQLPSHDNPRQTKSIETVNHPNYMQSISVDSGCISGDEETTVVEPNNSRVSMRSLISVFKKFGTHNSPSREDKDSSPPKTFERQRSMPLRRFVVDPLVGSRRSRHGTPPPEHVKQEWHRSISLDEKSAATSRPRGPPPLPPPGKGKPYESNTKSPQMIKSTNHRVARQQDTCSVNIHGNNNHLSPVRTAPALPSITPPGIKKPMIPPGKNQTTSTISKSSKKESPPKDSVTQRKDSSPHQSISRHPLLPPVRQSEVNHADKPSKTFHGSSKPQAGGSVPLRSITAGKVKDLAKKLEKQ